MQISAAQLKVQVEFCFPPVTKLNGLGGSAVIPSSFSAIKASESVWPSVNSAALAGDEPWLWPLTLYRLFQNHSNWTYSLFGPTHALNGPANPCTAFRLQVTLNIQWSRNMVLRPWVMRSFFVFHFSFLPFCFYLSALVTPWPRI